MASEHATSRVQFGKTLSTFSLIKEKFGIMEMEAYAIEVCLLSHFFKKTKIKKVNGIYDYRND